MKKILYLAMSALVLQSCLKDKDHESDIYNGVGADVATVSFTEPNTMREVNILKTGPVFLPTIDLAVKTVSQDLEVQVVCIAKPAPVDITVNLTEGDITKITEYNEAQKVLPALPAPQVLAYPVGYVPFVALPAGKYTFPTSIVIKAGATSAKFKINVPNSFADFSFTAKYMLPITLSSTTAKVVYPTSYFKVVVKNDFAGKFAYKGTVIAPPNNGGNPIGVDQVYDVTTAGEFKCFAPVGAFAPATNITLDFTGGTLNVGLTCPGNGLCGIAVVPPTLVPGTVPVLTFSADGKLQKISNLRYTYTTGAQRIINMTLTRAD